MLDDEEEAFIAHFSQGPQKRSRKLQSSALQNSFKHPPPPLIYNPQQNMDLLPVTKRTGLTERPAILSQSLQS